MAACYRRGLLTEATSMSLRRTFSHAANYYALYVGALAMVVSLGLLSLQYAYELKPLQPRDFNVQACGDNHDHSGMLRILDAVYIDDFGLAPAFCQAQGLRDHFSGVTVRRVHRDRLDLRDLYESSYQLILAKPELVSRAQADVGYEQIARYPHYGSQLVALSETPVLTRQWLGGKVLGLLDDANSISAYQIPIAALKARDLFEVPAIVYFRSYRQLYRALFEGKVDVIPALLSDEGPDSRLQLPEGLVLQERIAGPAWYLQREFLLTPEHCALEQALLDFSGNASLDFFRGLTLVNSCRHE